MKKQLLKRVILILSAFILFFTMLISPNVQAEDNYIGPMSAFMMSPMTSRMTLNPGDTYTGSFWIVNPEENTASIKYTLQVKSFYRDDDSKAIFEDVEGRGRIAEWITLDVPESNILAPKTSDEIKYTIKVPSNAPGGGQYAAIAATSIISDNNGASAVNLSETIVMAHTIFAEITGQTKKSGEITDLSSPGFISDGDIVAKSRVANTGNVHGTATYTLEVYPIFSDHPIYSNASNPDKKLILPDRTIIHETAFENTPSVGLFNIYYKVEFESGEVKELRKLVIKCPVWVVFIIFLVLIGLTTLAVIKIKKRSARRKLQ
ncbi:hypothetical protein J6S55_03180 [Candidatus Saccharibacteria bacterium]|nr:hypothetical protein [Candidatus Saccharibacteria bacterium]